MRKLSDEEEIVFLVDRVIATAERLGLDHSVRILKMARLDIVAQLNGITTRELQAFAAALSKQMEVDPAGVRPLRERYAKARARSKLRRTRPTRATRTP